MNASYKLKCEKECLILDILLQHIVFSKKKKKKRLVTQTQCELQV